MVVYGGAADIGLVSENPNELNELFVKSMALRVGMATKQDRIGPPILLLAMVTFSTHGRQQNSWGSSPDRLLASIHANRAGRAL
jgi:hypothetical protein